MEEESTLYERGYHGVVHSVLWVQRGGALIRDRLQRRCDAGPSRMGLPQREW